MHEERTIPRVCQQCGRDFLARKSRVKVGQALFCSWTCRYPGSIEDRFWAKVDRNGPIPPRCPELGPCWPWAGSKSPLGYGNAWNGTRLVRASRMAYEFTYGPMEDGKESCHRCDYPPCCRPDHIFAGTHRENMLDLVTKGYRRESSGIRNGAYTHPERMPRGERHGHARLTEDDVREIRRLYAAGSARQVDIAAQFGVPQTNVSSIVRRKAWAHVK
jgi:hypothetical protein